MRHFVSLITRLGDAYLEVLFGEELEHIPVGGLLLLELSLDGLNRLQELILCRLVVRVEFEDSGEIVFGQIVLLLAEVGLTSAEEPLFVVGIDGQCFIAVLNRFGEVVDFKVSHGQIEVTGQQQLLALGLVLAVEVIRRTQQLNDALVLLYGQLVLAFL